MVQVDMAKRRRVMQRSMKLGHCVCEPRRACPCDAYTSEGICPCAGERPDPIDMSSVRLTEHVHSAGCASKIAPADLEAVLSRLPAVNDPNVLSGIAAGDDAGIYKLNGLTIVQTVDVFTPCVDSPRMFGRICAANCLSDIYAMGATPRTALSILAFPSERLDGRIMYEMLAGAMETLAEAGVALIGGHSVKDEEIKLGFAITGVADGAAIERRGAGVGDMLVLTKPLGTGVLTFAKQVGRPHAEGLAAAERSMAQLNRAAAEAMRAAGATAATDVTGFGLFGHLLGMARDGGLTAEVWADALPALPGAMELLRDGVVSGAVERNGEYVGEDLVIGDGVAEAAVQLGLDAQTSGGLLIAVPAGRAEVLAAELGKRGVSGATIGRMVGRSSGQIHLVASGGQAAVEPAAQPAAQEQASCCSEAQAADAGGSANETARAFAGFMRAAGAGGAIDERTKELMMLSLVLHARCGPCLEAHLVKAERMGITPAEIEEAMWAAAAMGGAPVRMFYEEHCRRKPAPAGGESCC